MPENEPAMQLWAKVHTQWRVGMSLVGLDYPAVLATAAVFGITVTPALFRDVQMLEADTLQEYAEKMKHEQEKSRNRAVSRR